MRFRVYVLDLEIPATAKRWGLRLGIPAVVLSFAAVAFAAPLHVWSNGDALQAADLNGNFTALQGQITTATLGPRTPSAFRAELTTATSIQTATQTTLAFNSSLYDLANEYSATTGVFSAKQAGVYLIDCGVQFNTGQVPGSVLSVALVKNGGEVAAFDQPPSTSMKTISVAARGTVQLATGDAVSCRAYQDSGVAQSLVTFQQARNFFSATRLY